MNDRQLLEQECNAHMMDLHQRMVDNALDFVEAEIRSGEDPMVSIARAREIMRQVRKNMDNVFWSIEHGHG